MAHLGPDAMSALSPLSASKRTSAQLALKAARPSAFRAWRKGWMSTADKRPLWGRRTTIAAHVEIGGDGLSASYVV